MVIVKSKSSLNNQSQVLWEMLWVNMTTAPFKSCLASLTQIRQQTNSSSFVLRKRGTFAFFVPNIECVQIKHQHKLSVNVLSSEIVMHLLQKETVI